MAAQIANGYETAEVPMYSEQLRMPDRKVIIKIIENLQKVFFPAYFAGGTVSHVSAETFAEFLLGEIYTDLREQVHLAFSNTIKDEAELRERTSAVCDRFLCRLPQIQAMLMKDVAANFDGDPAAKQQGGGHLLLPRPVRDLRLPRSARALREQGSAHPAHHERVRPRRDRH